MAFDTMTMTYQPPIVEIEVPEIDYSQIETEDDQPVDNIVSEREMYMLRHALYVSWRINGERPIFVALANVGVFYRPDKPAVVPDMFISLGVELPKEIRDKKDKSYFIWRYGKPPAVVVEIVSNKKGDELDGKRKLYAEIGVSYYIVHDPLQYLSETKLHIFERHGTQLARTSERWLEDVGIGVTLWTGTYEGMTREWLRWVDEDGNLLITGQELAERAVEQAEVEARRAEAEAQRAEAEAQRAAQLAAKLRELGVDPDTF